jgi:hypothetical protein
MVLGWPPFKIVSGDPTKMAAKLKIEKRGDEILIVHVQQFQRRRFKCDLLSKYA